jgi:hypothetical protein
LIRPKTASLPLSSLRKGAVVRGWMFDQYALRSRYLMRWLFRCAALRSETPNLAKVAPPACLNNRRQDQPNVESRERPNRLHRAQKPLKVVARPSCLVARCRRKVAPLACADHRSGQSPLASRPRSSASCGRQSNCFRIRIRIRDNAINSHSHSHLLSLFLSPFISPAAWGHPHRVAPQGTTDQTPYALCIITSPSKISLILKYEASLY